MSERGFCFITIYVADREIMFCVFLICCDTRTKDVLLFESSSPLLFRFIVSDKIKRHANAQ